MDDVINENRRELGRLIKAERESQGLSQRKLALMIGMHNSHLGRIEAGTCNPSLDTLSRIVSALGVELEVSFKK